jgi:hypothetical protein
MCKRYTAEAMWTKKGELGINFERKIKTILKILEYMPTCSQKIQKIFIEHAWLVFVDKNIDTLNK